MYKFYFDVFYCDTITVGTETIIIAGVFYRRETPRRLDVPRSLSTPGRKCIAGIRQLYCVIAIIVSVFKISIIEGNFQYLTNNLNTHGKSDSIFSIFLKQGLNCR